MFNPILTMGLMILSTSHSWQVRFMVMLTKQAILLFIVNNLWSSLLSHCFWLYVFDFFSCSTFISLNCSHSYEIFNDTVSQHVGSRPTLQFVSVIFAQLPVVSLLSFTLYNLMICIALVGICFAFPKE